MPGTGTPSGLWVSLLVFGVIGWAAWFFTERAERRRHERNRAYATRLGWEYRPEDPSFVDAFESPPFGVGRKRLATDVMGGIVRERGIVVFGYRYVTGSGKNREVHDVRVCAVRIPGRIPQVRFSPENPATRLMVAFGGTDVEVESEEFNRRWRVWSRDVRAAHAILTPTMIDRFLDDDLTWKTVTFEPGFLIMCADGKLDLPSTPLPLDTLCDIADIVPGFLTQDYPAS
jgi:hypothetical protein